MFPVFLGKPSQWICHPTVSASDITVQCAPAHWGHCALEETHPTDECSLSRLWFKLKPTLPLFSQLFLCTAGKFVFSLIFFLLQRPTEPSGCPKSFELVSYMCIETGPCSPLSESRLNFPLLLFLFVCLFCFVFYILRPNIGGSESSRGTVYHSTWVPRPISF